MTSITATQECNATTRGGTHANHTRWARILRKALAWVCRRSLDQRLRLAVGIGDWLWAEEMRARGADINFAPVAFHLEGGMKYCLRRPRTRMTSLHLACIRGDFEAAAWLLGHGANRKIIDTWGTVPLQLAAEREFLELIALFEAHGDLLDHRMPVYTTYAIDWTPDTVREHAEKLGFTGDEHLRHMAVETCARMKDETPALSTPDSGSQALARF